MYLINFINSLVVNLVMNMYQYHESLLIYIYFDIKNEINEFKIFQYIGNNKTNVNIEEITEELINYLEYIVKKSFYNKLEVIDFFTLEDNYKQLKYINTTVKSIELSTFIITIMRKIEFLIEIIRDKCN